MILVRLEFVFTFSLVWGLEDPASHGSELMLSKQNCENGFPATHYLANGNELERDPPLQEWRPLNPHF
ncbi:MAG: hypothetical protein ABSG13_23555 [Bryobacteraceae bacterium]